MAVAKSFGALLCLSIVVGVSGLRKFNAMRKGNDTADMNEPKKCEWFFESSKRCELRGLRRRTSEDTQNICKTSGDNVPRGEARKQCTGHWGEVSEGEISNAKYAESFDKEGVVGAWTTKGGNKDISNELDSDENWKCMEDEKYNWVDFDDCEKALPPTSTASKHPDDVKPLMICWSCAYIMWYKKEQCECCNPDVLIGPQLNGEECCDGIDMACGLNGHDRRDGTPRGSEVCNDPRKVSKACEKLLETEKPLYSASSKVGGEGAIPYVHSQEDYKTWLKWDPNLCYKHKSEKWCNKFASDCKWMLLGNVSKCRSIKNHKDFGDELDGLDDEINTDTGNIPSNTMDYDY